MKNNDNTNNNDNTRTDSLHSSVNSITVHSWACIFLYFFTLKCFSRHPQITRKSALSDYKAGSEFNYVCNICIASSLRRFLKFDNSLMKTICWSQELQQTKLPVNKEVRSGLELLQRLLEPGILHCGPQLICRTRSTNSLIRNAEPSARPPR